MKVVLLQNVPGTGQAGEIKEVSDGFALNSLFPQKKARPAKQSDLSRKHNKSTIQVRLDKRDDEYRKIKKSVSGQKYTMMKKADEQGTLFGSVSGNDIVKLLKSKQITLQPKMLHFQAIKEVGSHKIVVSLGAVGDASFTINVVAE
jgi:large subunit ribosomal protein L9